jgi:hypothetical protein
MNSASLPEYSITIPPRSTTPNSTSSNALTYAASNGNQPYSVDKAFAANARKASHGQPPIRNLLLNVPPVDPMVRQIIRGEPPRLKSKSKKRRKRSSPTSNSNSSDFMDAQKVQDLKNQVESSKAAFQAAQYQETELQSSLERLIQQRDEKILGIQKSITVTSIGLLEADSEKEQVTDDKEEHIPQSEAEKEIIKQQLLLQEKIQTLTNDFEQSDESYHRKEQELEHNKKRRLVKEEEEAQVRKRKLEILSKELDMLDDVEDDKKVKNDDQKKEDGEEIEEISPLSNGTKAALKESGKEKKNSTNAESLQSELIAKEVEVSANYFHSIVQSRLILHFNPESNVFLLCMNQNKGKQNGNGTTACSQN